MVEVRVFKGIKVISDFKVPQVVVVEAKAPRGISVCKELLGAVRRGPKGSERKEARVSLVCRAIKDWLELAIKVHKVVKVSQVGHRATKATPEATVLKGSRVTQELLEVMVLKAVKDFKVTQELLEVMVLKAVKDFKVTQEPTE